MLKIFEFQSIFPEKNNRFWRVLAIWVAVSLNFLSFQDIRTVISLLVIPIVLKILLCTETYKIMVQNKFKLRVTQIDNTRKNFFFKLQL